MRLAYILLPVLNTITVSSHMALVQPCPRFSRYDPKCPNPPPGFTVDYDIKNAISTKDQIFAPLCKYTTPYTSPTENWVAGQDITVKFQPDGASHGGGHCQFALSYDGGKTFVVIYDVKRYCFVTGPQNANNLGVSQYTFTLPQTVPAGKNVVFAWTWINAIGNREYYMNCADVSIESKSSSFVGPELLIVNYGPSYPVVEEFNGNYEMGIDLLNKRKLITVSSSGQTNFPSSTAAPLSTRSTTSYSSPSTQMPFTSITSASKPPTSITSASRPSTSSKSTFIAPTFTPIPSKSTISAKTSNNIPFQTKATTACTNGQMKCDADNPFIYYICNFGEFISRPVAPGTKCANKEGSIELVMA